MPIRHGQRIAKQLWKTIGRNYKTSGKSFQLFGTRIAIGKQRSTPREDFRKKTKVDKNTHGNLCKIDPKCSAQDEQLENMLAPPERLKTIGEQLEKKWKKD